MDMLNDPNWVCKFLVYSMDVTLAEAKADFQRRYGEPPKRGYSFAEAIWLGPIPAQFVESGDGSAARE